MLAPVGALPFLFGGVDAGRGAARVPLLLGLIAGLSVAFGLAMSSKFASPAVAILVTLFVALPLARSWCTVWAGSALSIAVHDLGQASRPAPRCGFRRPTCAPISV